MEEWVTAIVAVFAIIGGVTTGLIIFKKVQEVRQDKIDQERRDRNKLVMDIADQVERRFDRAIRRLENGRNSSS